MNVASIQAMNSFAQTFGFYGVIPTANAGKVFDLSYFSAELSESGRELLLHPLQPYLDCNNSIIKIAICLSGNLHNLWIAWLVINKKTKYLQTDYFGAYDPSLRLWISDTCSSFDSSEFIP